MGFFDFLNPETQSTEFEIKIDFLKEKENVYGIFVKGFPRITANQDHIIFIDLYDVTQEKNWTNIYPIFQEQRHPFQKRFHLEVEVGNLYNKGWTDWAPLEAIFPDKLIAAYSGWRKLSLGLHIWKADGRSEYLTYGLRGDKTSAYREFSKRKIFNLELTSTGYVQANKDQIKIQEAAIKLAVSIAYADGSFDKEEGLTIKKWIETILQGKPESQKSDLKKVFNEALEVSYRDSKSGILNLGLICDDIRDIGLKNDKYELIELCLDVMASDGEADKNELSQIYKIADMIGIDYEEILEMKDKRIILLDPATYSDDVLEEKIGILKGWSNDEINQHIVKQYAKWNGRLNTLQEGKEKDNAQAMLNLLAEARKKYS